MTQCNGSLSLSFYIPFSVYLLLSFATALYLKGGGVLTFLLLPFNFLGFALLFKIEIVGHI